MEFCGKHIHNSFQIRLPYIKGVVHEMDFKSLFAELGVPYIVDIWGKNHPIQDIDLILTKSMFKGFGWMSENNLTWAEYMGKAKAGGNPPAFIYSLIDTSCVSFVLIVLERINRIFFLNLTCRI